MSETREWVTTHTTTEIVALVDALTLALNDARATLFVIQDAGTGRTKVLHRMNEDGTLPSKLFHWREDLSASAAMAKATIRNIDRVLTHGDGPQTVDSEVNQPVPPDRKGSQ